MPPVDLGGRARSGTQRRPLGAGLLFAAAAARQTLLTNNIMTLDPTLYSWPEPQTELFSVLEGRERVQYLTHMHIMLIECGAYGPPCPPEIDPYYYYVAFDALVQVDGSGGDESPAYWIEEDSDFYRLEQRPEQDFIIQFYDEYVQEHLISWMCENDVPFSFYGLTDSSDECPDLLIRFERPQDLMLFKLTFGEFEQRGWDTKKWKELHRTLKCVTLQ